MNTHKILSTLFVFALVFFNCSKDDSTENIPNDDDLVVVIDPDDNDDDQTDDDSDASELTMRYVFDANIVIENSYNTGGCDSPPCDTNDESLVGIFDNAVPDDPYFYLSEDQTELFLECQQEEGRRIEFKQRSDGPLSTLSKLTLEGVYYDIPSTGITIAQVHNRGGTGNKPFFRLVLYSNTLETVVRKDPEVSSSETSFSKIDFPFIDGTNYEQFTLKTMIAKNQGEVHISVEQDGIEILNETYQPDPTTRWVTDSGIANGFYVKAGIYNDDGDHTKNIVAGFTTVVFESDDN